MKGTTFYIVDVFAEQKYAGNQLAVFRDAAALPSDEMQAIAREMHFSETTFIRHHGRRQESNRCPRCVSLSRV
jgi:trans-2,3-dihydro-3-hydroxyanthranilate isomerase